MENVANIKNTNYAFITYHVASLSILKDERKDNPHPPVARAFLNIRAQSTHEVHYTEANASSGRPSF